MTEYFKPALLAALLALSATTMSGCKEASPPTVADSTVSASLSPTMKKLGAAIAFDHSYDGNSDIYEVESFELIFRPTQTIDYLSIDIRSPDKILLGGNQSLTPSVSGKSPIVVPVIIQANTEGKFYLNILVQTEQGGARLGRAFAVAIKVGETSAAQKSDYEGDDNVHIMPAQEDIR
jgi:hypothetical protein